MYNQLEIRTRTARARTLTLLTITSFALAVAVAPASVIARSDSSVSTAQVDTSAACIVHSLPSFIAQGELELENTIGDIVEVECNPEALPPGTPVEISDAQLFSRCPGGIKWVTPSEFGTGELREELGRGITVGLDGDGNATVALVAGPHCAVGETVVSAHTGAPLFESIATSFSVEGPKPTAEGVMVTPTSQVESTGASSVATILTAEFPASGEGMVRVAAPELFSRCLVGEHLSWLRMNKEIVSGRELAGGTALEPTGTEAIKLDNDGNAFVIAIGHSSCKTGRSIFEADLESSPFTTLTTEFVVLPPQPTPEPSFTIEKLQKIAGSGGGFTTAQLEGTVGATVEYEIVVANTTGVPETFSQFVDANCDSGTIAGGPGASPVGPGQSTTYTCTRLLPAVGTYTNEASVTGVTPGGRPLTKTSNQVVVTVPEPPKPAFVVEKLQEIAGSGRGFTSAPLEGSVGATVDYEVVVKNVGNTPLSFEFSDPFCDPGTVMGGPGGTPIEPGASTVYTCTRNLPAEGIYVNVASLTGTPPSGPPIVEPSQPVEVVVPPSGSTPSEFTVEKLQEIAGSGSGFTSLPLKGTVGATVDYKIVVKNIGLTPLNLEFSDAFCDPGTIMGGPGGKPIAPGASTEYTCTRALPAAGTYVNVATVTGTPPGGVPILEAAPPVEVTVPSPPTTPGATSTPPGGQVSTQSAGKPGPKQEVAAACEAKPALQGASGPKRKTFSVHVASKGISRITFYVDGRKLKTLAEAQAKKGMFTVKINPRKLSFGAHRLSFTTVQTNPDCTKTARSSVFVHPFSAKVPPKFTG
jgi:hypothetical protein